MQANHQCKTQSNAQTILQRTAANSDSDIGRMDFPLFTGKNPERSVVTVVDVVELGVEGEVPQ